MSKRKSHVMVGELTYTNIEEEEITSKMIEFLSSGEEIEQNNKVFLWVLGDYYQDKIDGEKVLFARLGKIRREHNEDMYDEEKSIFTREPIKTPKPQAVDYSNFIVHPSSKLIVFEERYEISIKQFTEYFEALYRKFFVDEYIYIKIELIEEYPDTEDIYGIIDNYDKVPEVKFSSVTPTNPGPSKEFKPLDDDFKESNVDDSDMDFRGKEDDLKIKEGTLIKQAIDLCRAGYGNFLLSLLDIERNEKDIYDSKDDLIKSVIYVKDEPREIIKKFYRKIEYVLNKFR